MFFGVVITLCSQKYLSAKRNMTLLYLFLKCFCKVEIQTKIVGTSGILFRQALRIAKVDMSLISLV